MKFFVDTADVQEIRALVDMGLVDGVTTNPSLVKKSGGDFLKILQEICAMAPGPISAEVVAMEYDAMMREAQVLTKIDPQIAIKLPITADGLKACQSLASKGVMVNMTLCFSANQAILAAKAGATFVSPFIGRHDDVSWDGMQLIDDIRIIYDNYDFDTEILVASIRHPVHVLSAAKIGADICTIPPDVLRKLMNHPLTDKGIKAFLNDWSQTGQVISA